METQTQWAVVWSTCCDRCRSILREMMPTSPWWLPSDGWVLGMNYLTGTDYLVFDSSEGSTFTEAKATFDRLAGKGYDPVMITRRKTGWSEWSMADAGGGSDA